MKKYYLSKIKAVQEGNETFYRHRLQDIDYVDVEYLGGEIKVDQVTGIPTEKALLVLVGGVDHKRFQDDPELVPIPDVALDVKVSATKTLTKLDFKSKAKGLGLANADVDGIVDNADGWRDVVNALGQKNNAAFDCNNFDLDDL